nr:response regulator transcription factor [Actinospica robiniae]
MIEPESRGADAEPAGPGPVTVVVVDDHGMVRAGVRSELREVSAGAIEIVGEAYDVESAVAAVRALSPQVVLLDVHLPGGGGIEVLRRCVKELPETRFLALSVSDAPEDVIAVIREGARGYVTKSVSRAELLDAVLRVAAGDAAFSPRLAGFVLDAFRAGAAESAVPALDPELDVLTAREQEVLVLIARGYSYKESARELSISIRTVETHVSSVLRKLRLSNRRELSRWAIDRRIR